MTTPQHVAGVTQDAAGQTAGAVKDEAAQTTDAAKTAVVDVAGTAKDQVGEVASEAINQVRQLTDQARTQASQQASNATEKLGDSIRRLAAEMRDMSQGNANSSGTVAGLAQQLADKGEQLAEYVTRQGPGGLVQELRSFAARKPGSFLFGAIAAGVVTGRLVKGVTAGGQSSQSGQASPQGQYGQSQYGQTSGYPSSGQPAYGTLPAYTDDPYPVAPATGSVTTHGDVFDDELMEETSAYGTLPAGEQHVLDREFGDPTTQQQTYEFGRGQ
jgi:hypothetical protein